ncbi:MAG: hypothetical protein QM776_09585 [Rhodocyclaceae bacterium]
MSTVLWANVLVDGKVKSDQADHRALYKHAGKLDRVCRGLGLSGFLSVCDTTDQRFNLDDTDLPAGMSSTDEMMAASGVWMPIVEAVLWLQTLRDHIVSRNVRFGLLSNQYEQVLAELDEVLAFARAEAATAQQFNFSVVM